MTLAEYGPRRSASSKAMMDFETKLVVLIIQAESIYLYCWHEASVTLAQICLA
jgi:hypothetical protein